MPRSCLKGSSRSDARKSVHFFEKIVEYLLDGDNMEGREPQECVEDVACESSGSSLHSGDCTTWQHTMESKVWSTSALGDADSPFHYRDLFLVS